uniref:Uncharacterized protein n=1 Tax=Burkholderia phage vB_BgluM-SURPRISE13 TaxID=3159457 RepID=A0AAU7PH80_9VIRU
MSNKDLGKVIAIQVAPFKELEQGSVEVQFDGADADTDGYGIYLRHENGMAMHSRDCTTEAEAVRQARELCKEFRVKVEPYGWQVGLVQMGPDVIVDDTKAFESFALKQNFIKDVQRYDQYHPYYANQYGHYDTKNAKVMWDGAVAWVLAVLGHAGFPRDYLNGGDIRVVVQGRTGVGKSALCGIICDKLRVLGIPVTWNDEEYETAVKAEPWEALFQQQCVGATVRVVEKNLVPRIAYEDMQAERGSVMGVLQEIQHKGVEDESHYFIRAAVQHYINPNMLNIPADDPDRDAKMSAIVSALVDYLYETHQENAGLKFEQRVKNFIRQRNAPSVKQDIYPGPDGEQQ